MMYADEWERDVSPWGRDRDIKKKKQRERNSD